MKLLRDFNYRVLSDPRLIYTAVPSEHSSRWWVIAIKNRKEPEKGWSWIVGQEDRAKLEADPRIVFCSRLTDDKKSWQFLAGKLHKGYERKPDVQR